jgi:hypothetical protein
MTKQISEQTPAELHSEEMSQQLFDANMHVVMADQSAADTKAEIAKGIREGTITMASHEEVAATDAARYVEQRRAQRELKRAERREAWASRLGRFGLRH